MALATTLARVETDIAARVAGCTFATGHRYVAAQPLAARVVWVPVADAFGPATGGGRNPRPLYTCLGTVEAHLWAATFADAETLRAVIIAALRREVSGPNLQVRSGEWDEPAWLTRGFAYVLAFALATPIADDVAPTVTVAALAHDNDATAQGDGYLDTGETT